MRQNSDLENADPEGLLIERNMKNIVMFLKECIAEAPLDDHVCYRPQLRSDTAELKDFQSRIMSIHLKNEFNRDSQNIFYLCVWEITQ